MEQEIYIKICICTVNTKMAYINLHGADDALVMFLITVFKLWHTKNDF